MGMTSCFPFCFTHCPKMFTQARFSRPSVSIYTIEALWKVLIMAELPHSLNLDSSPALIRCCVSLWWVSGGSAGNSSCSPLRSTEPKVSPPLTFTLLIMGRTEPYTDVLPPRALESLSSSSRPDGAG